MKKLILVILIALGSFIKADAQLTITKTPSVTSAHVGEQFTYTINISGITNLSDLGSIKDVLDSRLQYVTSDFDNGSGVFGFYSFWCPASISSLTRPVDNYVGTTLVFNFPTTCGGSGSGQLSFTITVFVKPSACPPNNGVISNTVTLFNQDVVPLAVATSNATAADVSIDVSNPWTLKKTFREFNAGYLIYDVRLSSSVGLYNTPVFTVADFKDVFTPDPCIGAVAANSRVDYVIDEATGSNITVGSGSFVGPNIEFNWSLPNITLPTRSTYLFQVKIKVSGCTCTSPFNLLNHSELNAQDICTTNFTLNSDFPLMNVMCTDAGITPPEQPQLCVKKEVVLNDNQLNLTMTGCKGKYIITITNCTSTYNYTSITLTDNLPSPTLLTIDPSLITVSPSTYTVSVGGNILTLNPITTPLPHGGTITIEIPFEVFTSLPNQIIQNCADVTVVLDDIPLTTLTSHFCDIGIRTVPNNVAIVKNKQICTTPVHTCGNYTINTNLPGDVVEYALHVYNYGTTNANNVIVTDNLPAYFNITDVKVYELVNSPGVISDACNISTFSDITSSVIKTISGNSLTVDFQSHILDKFTCSGITHYVIKIKTQIASNVVNGAYTNVFQVKYNDMGTGVTYTELSNPVTSIVNKDQLVFSKKEVSSSGTDCVHKTNTLTYKISVINMGYQPITVNISDQLIVPSPLSIITGISNIQYRETPTPGTWNSLVSSGPMTVSNTATTITINNYTIQPCTLLEITYTVILNTNNLTGNQVVPVCNKAVITLGYLVKSNYDPRSLQSITGSKDPDLINEFFGAKNDINKFKVLGKIEKDNQADKVKTDHTAILISGTSLIFVPFNTIKLDPVCINISDCVGGSGSGCFTNTVSNNFAFTVNSINIFGRAFTTLTVPAAAPKVRKVEYILSDIRMLLNTCTNPFPVLCHHCQTSLTGNFSTVTGILGTLSNQPIAFPSTGNYREKNKVEFSGTSYSNIAGTHNISFQLPTGFLNCNGNLEVVITAILYFEDCSICYVSSSRDYHASYNWYFPWDHQPIKANGGDLR
jgi:uncharacterized repeat protein (TIGR01451 family)